MMDEREPERRKVVRRDGNISVVEEVNHTFTGYVSNGKDEYPAATEMQSCQAAYNAAKEWEDWMTKK